MLSRFSVTNYMGFPEKITWDLSKPHDYAFNSNLIHNGIVKNGIIYGVNGSGKTSLGKAVFDIVHRNKCGTFRIFQIRRFYDCKL